MSCLIKYTLLQNNSKLPTSLLADNSYMQALDSFRTKLFDNAFIGFDARNGNVGNVSCRVPSDFCTQQEGDVRTHSSAEFLISPSATGKSRILGTDRYALVTKTCCASNTVEAQGLLPPSSESMSHAAVYAACPAVNVIVHGHHAAVYALGLETHVPATKATCLYGTTAVAEEISLIVAGQDAGFFIMLGHENGFFVYGRDIASVEKQCRDLIMCSKTAKSLE